jgi:thioredoxin 1
MTVHELRNSKQFQDLLSLYRLVVVDIYADWCGPCKMIAPTFDKFAETYKADDVAFARCNVDVNIFNNIRGLPTIQYYENGNLAKQVMGADLKKIEEAIVEFSKVSPNPPKTQTLQFPTVPSQIHHKKAGSGSAYRTSKDAY